MSEAARAFRKVIADRQAGMSGISVGRVEDRSDDGSITVNMGSLASNADGVRPTGGARPYAGDTGFLLHLDGMQAPFYWQTCALDVGGADPPVYTI